MRSSLLILLAACPLVACGGDDDGGKSITPLPDSGGQVFMDAAIDAPAACAVDSSIGTVAVGSMQMREQGDWFDTIGSGPLMGRSYFYVLSVLPTSAQTAIDAVIVEVLKPMNGNYTTNQALNFEASPTAATYTAIAYVLGDLNPQTETIGQFYWANNGSVTLTAIGEANGSMITGSATQTNFREIDGMTGADVAGGCTTSMTGMTFALTQMMTQQAPGSESDGLMNAAWNVIQRHKLARGIQ